MAMAVMSLYIKLMRVKSQNMHACSYVVSYSYMGGFPICFTNGAKLILEMNNSPLSVGCYYIVTYVAISVYTCQLN